MLCVYNNTKEREERRKYFYVSLLGMQIGRSRRYFAHKNCERAGEMSFLFIVMLSGWIVCVYAGYETFEVLYELN